jgi:hypothetical protein
MSYLIKRAAVAVSQPPVTDDDSWSGAGKGALIGGLLTIPGLGYAGKKALERFKKKLLTDLKYTFNTGATHFSQLASLRNLTGGDKSPFNWNNYLTKGKILPKLTPFGKGVNGASFALAGFRNLKLPGKLKALGLLAAPFATIPVGAGIGSALDRESDKIGPR